MKTTNSEHNYPFLQGGGSLGALTRTFNWSTTALGAPNQWPHSLRVSVSNLLRASLPMLIIWGEEQICFYNDAVVPTLEPQKELPVGKPAREIWPEVWNLINPQVDQVLRLGEPIPAQATPPVIFDRNNPSEALHWHLAYSLVLNDEGEPGGVLIVAMDATDQVLHTKTEEETNRKLRLYETIASSTPDLFYVFDLTYRFTYVNQALLTMWGSTWEKSIGKGLLENGYEPWHAEMHEREIDQVIATKQPIRGEVSFPHATLGRRMYDYLLAPIFNEKGEVEAIAGTTRDITDSKQALQLIEESQRELLSLFEQSPVGLATLSPDPELVFQWANAFYGDLVARPRQDIVGKPLLEALPELKGQGFDEILHTVIATGIPFSAHEVAVDILRDGQLTKIYVDLTYQPRKGAQEDVQGILVVATDVTQQVISRRKIEDNESQLRAILATAPAGIGLFVGRDLVIENPNQTFIDIVGKGPGIIGLPLREAMPELITEGQPFLQILDDVFTTGEPFISPGSLVKIVQNGVLRDNYYNISYSPVRNSAGEIYAILDIAIDVTQEVLARQQLQETEATLRGAIEVANMGTWTLDMRTGVTTYSERFRELFEFTQDYIEPDRLYSSIMESDRVRLAEAVSRAANPESGGLLNEEYTVVTQRTERLRIVQAQAQMYFDTQGKAAKLVGTIRDVTQERQTQLALEQLVQERTEELAATNEELAATNEELEASNEEYAALNEELEEANSLLIRSNNHLQTFAYVASHDLQEPLRKIQQFGNLLSIRQQSLSSEEQLYVERMQSAASRMSTLIRDLLNFSRISTQRDANKSVSLNDVIDRILSILELAISETDAQVKVGTLPTVQGDAAQLDMLFQNLLSNALKFRRVDASGVPVAPLILLESHTLIESQLPPSVKPTRTAQSYHRIDVVDNGIGFDEKYLDRIFQVFQRLHGKNEFAGTGIGLAICERVVANHGGAITASSQPGQGATFSVYLPQTRNV